MMKKLSSDDSDTLQDRLSELPDSLIFHILSFLNTRYVVRTTVLSKRWHHLWTTIPYLDFTGYEKNQDFINRALTLWKGTRILRFKIALGRSDYDFRKSLYGDMELWVRFAMGRNVEELCLQYSSGYHYHPYSLPQYVYSCSSITKLSLVGCLLRIHGAVHWDQLKSLTINVFHVTEEAINQVLSGAPRLEIFDFFSSGTRGVNLSIQSSSLRKLSICKAHYDEYDPMLTIWAPNLEELVLSGCAYSKCLMMDVSSLRDVNLDFGTDGEFTSSGPLHGETLRQILAAFKHVKVVTLSSQCFKAIAVKIMKGKCSFSPLSNVEILTFNCYRIEPKKIVGLLEIFPKLKMLAINWMIRSLNDQNIGEPLTSEEDILMKSLLMQLRTVKIRCPYVYEKLTFEFAEFILKHATVIEKMVIQKICRVAESEDTQKLVSLQRSFPSVDVKIIRKGRSPSVFR